MRNGRSKIDIPYLAVFSGILILVVIASLLLFPEWHESPAQIAFLIGTAVIALVGLAASFRSAFMPDKKDVPFARLDYDAPNHHRNQENVVANVRAYIEDLLPNSLPEPIPLKLGLGSPKDVVRWLRDIEDGKEPSHPLDTKSMADIADIFRRSGRILLLLGAPGSGKTTVLSELCALLLAQAETDSRQPVPVILNLSTWAQKPRPLDDWIIQEMLRQYSLNKSVTPSWLDADHLILLLDGLDEVALNARTACVQAINAFREYHGAGLVISSRSEDFQELSEKLAMLPVRRSEDFHELSRNLALLQLHAVGIAPLTSQQAQKYLSHPELKLSAVSEAISRDDALRELSATPLMLNVMAKAYGGRQFEELLPLLDNETERRAHLYDRYIERAFVHRPLGEVDYLAGQALCWSRFIAQRLTERGETQFFIEDIQADWLPGRRGLWIGIMSGVLGGMLFGMVGGVLGSVFGSVIRGVLGGVQFGAFIGVAVMTGAIKPVDELQTDFNPHNLGRSIIGNLRLGMLFGVLVGVLGLLQSEWLVNGPADVLFSMLGGVLFGVLVDGLRPLESKRRSRPNQGIRRSILNALRVGMLYSLLFSVLGGVLFGLLGGAVNALAGVLLGVLIGVLSGMFFYGGGAALRHYLLRLLLGLYQLLPFHLIPFLDAMRDRILLQRAGAHYRFIHRTFQEHIAGLTDERIAELTQGERAA